MILGRVCRPDGAGIKALYRKMLSCMVMESLRIVRSRLSGGGRRYDDRVLVMLGIVYESILLSLFYSSVRLRLALQCLMLDAQCTNSCVVMSWESGPSNQQGKGMVSGIGKIGRPHRHAHSDSRVTSGFFFRSSGGCVTEALGKKSAVDPGAL
ncbi:hypothetical protein F4813DRAFT_138491 [Daldinia decipiens]|uniref:uncharacterized protein n=1 Tax=Daldinia decipiens TaxID=326647 RepID=UPI0020C23D77|nr:uncharacterized protein F4813DRAFT_138491 [Daldinia decipiens]KAI1656215.1 hypothetical protein F4813DRAFT_138491 [Daldinia decipiens]